MCITQLVRANNVLRKMTFVTCLEAHKISAVYLLLLFFFLHTELVVNTLLYVIKFHHYCCISLHLPFPINSTTNNKKPRNCKSIINFKLDHLKIEVTNTVMLPIIITGFRPQWSATIPHKTDVRALPSMYEDPSISSRYQEVCRDDFFRNLKCYIDHTYIHTFSDLVL